MNLPKWLCSLFLIWLWTTAALGFSHRASHPNWVLLTIIPILILQFTLLKRLRTFPNLRDALYQGILVAILLICVFLTGLSTQMGFLPFGLHQFFAWLLVIFGSYEKIVLFLKWRV